MGRDEWGDPCTSFTIIFDGEPVKVGFRLMNGTKGEPEFTPISWEGFFALFDLLGLALVYDESSSATYELLQSEEGITSGFTIGAS